MPDLSDANDHIGHTVAVTYDKAGGSLYCRDCGVQLHSHGVTAVGRVTDAPKREHTVDIEQLPSGTWRGIVHMNDGQFSTVIGRDEDECRRHADERAEVLRISAWSPAGRLHEAVHVLKAYGTNFDLIATTYPPAPSRFDVAYRWVNLDDGTHHELTELDLDEAGAATFLERAIVHQQFGKWPEGIGKP